MYLADRIVLMTQGPDPRIAEIVHNPLPRDRPREAMHTLDGFYLLRHHLIDFLVPR